MIGWVCCAARYGESLEKSAMSMALKAFINSPVGPKTTHFWGPVANWGFVIAVCHISISVCVFDPAII
jgi:hypothetical protein